MRKTLVLAVVAAALPASADSFTPYSCKGVVAAPQTPQIDPDVLRPWRELNREADLDMWWLARVYDQAAVRLPALDVAARVRLQHELVITAQKIESIEPEGVAAHHEQLPALDKKPSKHALNRTRARILGLIRYLAATEQELAGLGDHAEPRIAGLLGPKLVQRATATCGTGNSIHVAYTGGLLAFRPLRDDSRRALVAQLVAFDRKGRPHVTPLVDAIEMRLGNAVSSPACVVQAADDGTLRVMPLDAIEQTTFVVRHGNGLGCVTCHSTDNTMNARDLGTLELVRVDALRDAQVEHAASSVWRAFYKR